jgi:hypothetical protein
MAISEGSNQRAHYVTDELSDPLVQSTTSATTTAYLIVTDGLTSVLPIVDHTDGYLLCCSENHSFSTIPDDERSQ